jgi:hypothetical protein
MKNFPLLIVLFLLASAGISAFAVSGNGAEKRAVTQASTALMDQLTDELQYIVDISDALVSRVYENRYIEMADEMARAAQRQNRELCRLAIARDMAVKQAITAQHQKKLVLLMPLRGKALIQTADELLAEEFQRIDELLEQYQNNVDDQEILTFIESMQQVNQDLKRKISILKREGA